MGSRSSPVSECDVLIAGAGPAGAAVAIALAARFRVVVVERAPAAPFRYGEALAGAALPLIDALGARAAFEAQGHRVWQGNRTVWNGVAGETDFLTDPLGCGRHLDRAAFDALLRNTAALRGAVLRCPARITEVTREGGGWQARVASGAASETVRAWLLIDATGRAAALARRLGARLTPSDRLICIWSCSEGAAGGAGFSATEATEDGWWYAAPVPDQRRVLAFHTDADLPAARAVRDPVHWPAGARVGVVAANSAVLEPCAGAGWLAVGDAAAARDPLGAQGLYHALFTARAAAEAAEDYLRGARDSLSAYATMIAAGQRAYQQGLAWTYAQERRWPEAPFWRRRREQARRYHSKLPASGASS